VKNLEPRRARWMRLRIGMLVTLMALGASRLVTAAWGLQVDRHDSLEADCARQYSPTLRLAPRRGTIFDRHHRPLAVSVPSQALVVSPRQLAAEQGRSHRRLDVGSLAIRLAPLVGMSAEDVRRRLQQTRPVSRERTGAPELMGSVVLKHHLTDAEVASVRGLLAQVKSELHLGRVEGVSFEEESRRWYPAREDAAHITGQVGAYGDALDGLERSLDEHLKGRNVEVQGVRDARGTLVFAEGLRPGEGMAGEDVTLSIDSTIQMIASRELSLQCQAVEAHGGSVIVTDPRTGEVLALANYPTYNPNEFVGTDMEPRRNRAITERFEPGSTMKIFTVGGALDNGVVDPGQQINCYGGSYSIGRVTIHDTHPDTWLTPMQVLARSSNIGAAQIGAALGADGLERVLRRYGFGERTEIPLPGEARARFGQTRWVDAEVATVAFGQGVNVTAIQMAQALGSVANQGRLMPPLLVTRITDASGALVEDHPPGEGRAVMRPETARLLAEMLTAVTEEGGTGTEAAIPGVRVAGKTGTAQKANLHSRGYDPDRWVSSFVGFAPAERPRLAITVIIDEPQMQHSGAAIAAPVFRRVMEQSLRYLGALPAAHVGRDDLARLPPRPERVLAAQARAAAAPSTPNAAPTVGAAPSLLGLSVREAVRRAQPLGLELEVQGSGLVVAQDPPAGTAVGADRRVRVQLEPAGGYTPVLVDPPASAEVPR
jgi:cell division protein FtsI (penicillin-binding protein 3)